MSVRNPREQDYFTLLCVLIIALITIVLYLASRSVEIPSIDGTAIGGL